MEERSLKIFIIQTNPYSHHSSNWYEKLNTDDIIHLKESDYYLLEKRFNLWECINKELSEESGYMGGPTIWEDTWINNADELFRIKQKVKSLIEKFNSNSGKEMSILSDIFSLVNKSLEKGYWLVFDF